jgi:hypothetical protein
LVRRHDGGKNIGGCRIPFPVRDQIHIIHPELFIGFAKNKKVGSLMNVCFIISTKTKSTLFPHLKKGKVPL